VGEFAEIHGAKFGIGIYEKLRQYVFVVGDPEPDAHPVIGYYQVLGTSLRRVLRGHEVALGLGF